MLIIPELLAARGQFKPVECPHCGKRLNGLLRIIVATRNCPYCGRRVVAEPEADGTAPPFTREQLDAACDAYARAQRRAGWVIIAAFLAYLVYITGLALYRDAVKSFIDSEGFMLLVLFGPLLVLLSPTVVILIRATRAALKCPRCNHPCSVSGPPRVLNPTRITGNCANCGRRVVNEPPPEEPTGPLPTIDEFQAADARFQRASLPLLYLMLGLAVAYLIGFMVALNRMQLYVRTFEERIGAADASLLVSGMMLVTSLVAGGVFYVTGRLIIRWIARRRKAVPILNCPHCREGVQGSGQVIASQRCPSCRRRVLAEPAPAVAVPGG
jgi:endogenous inhibitor of DNA gyrase (YacG/DUF329 family)